MNVGTQLDFYLICNPGPQPVGRWHLHLGSIFLLQLTQSRKSLTDTVRLVFKSLCSKSHLVGKIYHHSCVPQWQSRLLLT